MKRIISCILSILMVISTLNGVPVSVSAADAATEGSCGAEAVWEYDENTKTLEIGGFGAMDNYTTTNPAPWNAYKAEITTLNIGEGITKLGDFSFYELTALTSVSLPRTLTSLGEQNLAKCSSLESITVNSENTVYDSRNDCNAIIQTTDNTLIRGCKNTVISDSVAAIGKSAFQDCTGLTSITIPESVTKMGEYAFAGCSNLTTVNIKSLESWCNIDYNNASYPFNYPHDLYLDGEKLTDIVIPNSVTELKDDVFEYCASIKSVTLPSGLTKIGKFAFHSCTELTSISVPNGVITIGYGAFRLCSKLAEVVLPDSLTSLGASAFNFCSALERIDIPNGVKNIGEGTFYSCNNLKEVTIPASLTSVGRDAFNQTYVNKINIESLNSWLQMAYDGGAISNSYDLYLNGELVTDLVVPDGVSEVNLLAFSGCKSIKSVVIPDSVTSIGANAFSWCYNLTSVEIPNTVTSIGAWSFSRCENLKEVTIPASVTSIGRDAFYDTSVNKINIENLDNWLHMTYDGTTISNSYDLYLNGELVTDLVVPDGVSEVNLLAFSGCKSIKSVVIPDSVTSIGTNAFSRCCNLTSVEIPNTVTSIGAWSFSKCENLTQLSIPDSVTSIGPGAFNECNSLESLNIPSSVTNIDKGALQGYTGALSVTLPSNTTSISANAFKGCSGLTEIVIPNGVTTVGNNAFNGCTGLTSITIPDSVTSIGSSAFSGCTSLTSITIPDSVTSIGKNAFSGCTGLTEISIPDTVTSVGDSAFDGCTELETIYIGKGVTNALTLFSNILPKLKNIAVSEENPVYDSRNNCNALIETESNTLLIGASNTVIPNGITTIKEGAFRNRTDLTSIVIPESVVSIGAYAFSGCKGLKDIVIPDSVTSLGSGAFSGCGIQNVTIGSGLTEIPYAAFSGCRFESVIIPDSVVTIGEQAFGACTSLTDVTLGNSIKTIEKWAFVNCHKLYSIVIPQSVKTIGAGSLSTVKNMVVYSKDCTGTIGGNYTNNPQSLNIKCFKDSTTYEYFKDKNVGSLIILCTDGSENHSFRKNRPYCLNGCGAPNEHYDASYNGTCGEGVEWNYDDETYTLTVYGDGAMDNTQLWSAFAPYVKYVEIENGVTSIGNGSFKNCNNIVRVTIPESVTSIGDNAFEGCPWLRSIAVPGSVTSLGDGVFTGCRRLTLIDYAGTKAQWNAYAESAINADEIKKAVVYCTDGALYDKNLYYVENGAIYSVDKKKLIKIITVNTDKEFNVPSGVKVITEGAFENTDVEVVNCSETVTEIEKQALTGEELQVVNLSDSISTIDENAMDDEVLAVVYNNSVTHKALLKNNHSNIVSLELKSASVNVSATKSAKVKTPVLFSSSGTTTTLSTSAFGYTGREIKPTVIIMKNGKILSNNNYNDSYSSKEYKNNINAGKATIKVSLKGVTRSGRRVARNISFHIYYNANNLNAYLSTRNYTYNGNTPRITVKTPNGKNVPANQYSVSGLSSAVGEHKVIITTKTNLKGKGVAFPMNRGSIILTYKVRPKTTKVKRLKKGSKSITVKWKKQTKQVDGYQIQYSTNKKFKGAKTVTLTGAKKTTKRIKGLKGKKKYYVRIQTFKKVNGRYYFSDWSKVKRVKTKK